MPIYEYCCDSCMHRFELRRSFSDDSAVTCPRCSSDVRQIYSPAPIIFKGSGFYVTDVKGAKAPGAVKETETKTPAPAPAPAAEKAPDKAAAN